MFRGSFARFAAAFSLLAGTLAFTSPSASAQVNKLYVTASGGGWGYALSDNFDSTNDRVPDYKFYFYHYRYGTFSGIYTSNQDFATFRSRYNITSDRVPTRTGPTVTHDGVVTNRAGLRFTTTCNFIGGSRGYGAFNLVIYQDVAGTGGVANQFDEGKDRVIIRGNGSGINGAIVTYASTFDLNSDAAISPQDMTTFEQRLPRATIGGWHSVTDFPQADFNGDGRIDILDYQALSIECNSRGR